MLRKKPHITGILAVTIAVAVGTFFSMLIMDIDIWQSAVLLSLIVIGFWSPWPRFVLSIALGSTLAGAYHFFMYDSGSLLPMSWPLLGVRLFLLWIITLHILRFRSTRETMRGRESDFWDRIGELEHLYGTAPVGLCYVDTALRYQRVNEHLATLHGVPADQHIGCTVAEVMPQLAGPLEAAYHQVLATGQPVVNQELILTPPGDTHVRTLLANHYPARKNQQGNVLGVSSIVRDITTLKASERTLKTAGQKSEERLEERTAALQQLNKALRQEISARESVQSALSSSEARYRNLFIESMDGVFFTDRDGYVLDCNKAFLKLYGYSRSEVLAVSPEAYFSHAEAYDTFRQMLDEQTFVRDYEIRQRRKDGTEFTSLISASVMRSGADIPQGYQGIIRNVTTHREAERALTASARELLTYRRLSEISLSEQPLETVYNAIAEEIRQATGFNCVAIEWYDEARQQMIIKGCAVADGMKILSGLEIPVTETLSGLVVKSRRSLAITDALDRDEYTNEWLRRHNTQTFLCAPLIVRDTAIGALSLGDPAVRTVNDRFVSWIESLANFIAVVTERRRVEAALRESESKYRTLFEDIRDGLFITSVEGEILGANQALLDLFGISRDELSTINVLDLYRTQAERRAFQEAIALTGAIRDFEIIGKRKDGTHFIALVNATTRTDSDGNIVGYEGLLRDITEKKQAEVALKESEQRFRQLADNVEEIFWLGAVADPLEFIYVNPAFEKIWGIGMPELRKDPNAWLYAIHEEDRERVEQAFRRFVTQGTLRNMEFRIMNPDTGIRWIAVRGNAIRDDDGRIYRLAGVAADITERRSLEDQLHLRQRMDSIGTLAGGVAHDFNNLLQVIVGNLYLIELEQDILSKAQHTALSDANQACGRAADLIRQILTFSERKESVEASANLSKVADEVFAMLQGTTDRLIDKRMELPPDRFHVQIQSSDLHQILMNLAANAVQAIEERGASKNDYLRIAAEPWHAVDDQRFGLPDGEYVHITFEDTGVGIPESNQAVIFDPFFSTKTQYNKKGLGLGLSTVYTLVKRNGHIGVESTQAKGTTFHLYLPATAPAKPAAPTREEMPRRGRETIFVVDDEKMTCHTVEQYLTHLGYHVMVATDGEQGWSIFQRESDRIDLVLLDLVMPRMSGAMLMEKLLTIRPTVPVIVTSGFGEDKMRVGILAKAGGMIAKPYRMEKLAILIRHVLDTRKKRRPRRRPP